MNPGNQFRMRFAASLLAVAPLLTATPVDAASQRTFVSTGGVDNPTCSLAAPCRAFSAAAAATTPGGEVIVLESGGYGAVTISQSLSIIAPRGVYAGISVFSGHGITIATAATDTVVLRGLTINNQGSTGRGIFISGAGLVRMENVEVSGFTGASALNATPANALELDIRDSVFRGSNFGIALNHLNAAATAAISGSLFGVEIANNSTDGLAVGNNTALTLSHSIVLKNGGRGIGSSPVAGQSAYLAIDHCEIVANNQAVYPGDSPGTATFQVSRTHIVGNITGIAAGAGATIRVSDTVIEGNSYGVNIVGGILESAGNNVLRGNANFEPVLTTFPLR